MADLCVKLNEPYIVQCTRELG